MSIKDPLRLMESIKTIDSQSSLYTFAIKYLIILTQRRLIHKEVKESKAVFGNEKLLTEEKFDEYISKIEELMQGETYQKSSKFGKVEILLSEVAKLSMLMRVNMDSDYSSSIDPTDEFQHKIRHRFDYKNIADFLSDIDQEKDKDLKKFKIKTAIVLAHRGLILEYSGFTQNQNFLLR